MRTLRLLPILAFGVLGAAAPAQQPPPMPTALDCAQNIVSGCLLFCSDNRGIFATNQARMRIMISSYLASANMWTAPGDPPGSMSFSMNRLLAGKNVKTVAHPETLVMIYQGVGRDLYYQNGHCAIAFADGSVKSITPKESAKLRWKP